MTWFACVASLGLQYAVGGPDDFKLPTQTPYDALPPEAQKPFKTWTNLKPVLCQGLYDVFKLEGAEGQSSNLVSKNRQK